VGRLCPTLRLKVEVPCMLRHVSTIQHTIKPQLRGCVGAWVCFESMCGSTLSILEPQFNHQVEAA